jgi:hypothetical protein
MSLFITECLNINVHHNQMCTKNIIHFFCVTFETYILTRLPNEPTQPPQIYCVAVATDR